MLTFAKNRIDIKFFIKIESKSNQEEKHNHYITNSLPQFT